MFLFLRRAFAAASVTENRVRLSVQPLIVKKDAAGSHPGESTNSYFVGEHKWNREILSRLPPFDKESGALNIIVETPKNGRIKYKYNEEYGMFQLDKSLPFGFSFPFEFGFVPSTIGGDGDPLDVLVLSDKATFPGCLVLGRVLGVLQA
jgi:hypothetical protein